MSEERLKDLLHRAVPEAPEIRPDGVAERAAAVRRRQLVAGGATLAVVGAIVVGGLALRGSGGDDAQVATDVPTTPTGSTAPYDVPVCPARLPEIEDANRGVPNLDSVVAVRLCPDLYPGQLARRAEPPPSPDQIALLADQDALVHDLDGFREAVGGLPEGIPEMCATVDFLYSRESLMLIDADGTSTLLWTPPCSVVTVAGREVEGSRVGFAFLEALDRQRDELAYTRPFQGACGTSAGSGGPAEPGREQLISACYSGKGEPVQLDDEQMALLRAAWADPQPVTEQLNENTENDCTEGGDGTAIYAGTDRSDVVRMIWSPCGYLVWDSWRPGENAAIPITLEELGLR